jgi:hypothetical protein
VPARLGPIAARVVLPALAATIVVIVALRSWPLWTFGGDADRHRLGDLQRLAHAIELYRTEHDVLPATLARLPADPAAPVRTFDPLTNERYGYRPLGPLAYELCARFDAPAGDAARRDFWWHDAGRHCFSLEMRETRKPAPPAATAAPAATPAPESTGAPPQP